MPITPIITFKAGMCDLDMGSQPPRAKPRPTPGYIYLYPEDDLIHFCWRARSAPMSAPELDLVMVPMDAQFKPYRLQDADSSADGPRPPTNGRVYALKFSSSSQRHLFWLQSRSQSPTGDPTFFSARDLKLGSLVDKLLQGEDVNVADAITHIRSASGGSGEDDDDEVMEDAEGAGNGHGHPEGGAGGAGSGATGGDARQGSGESREGGADGGRASETEASILVQNLLNSLRGAPVGGGSPQDSDRLFTTLPDLLPPSTTVPIIASADRATIDHLLSFLPPTLFLLAQEADDGYSAEPTAETVQVALETLSLEQKKEILTQVLHAPHFNQSLGSLTVALRDGGLPTISEALGIRVRNGGYMRAGGMPLGGGEAIEAFVEGVKQTVEEEKKREEKPDNMDVDR